MSNLTLTAFYGPKPDALAALVEELQALLRARLGEAFSGYELEQVHATIIGLEGRREAGSPGLLSANYLDLRQERRVIDLPAALGILAAMAPFTVRIGGYREEQAYPFQSQGQHPYARSFGIRGEIAVAMGWPCAVGPPLAFPPVLDQLRRAFNAANLLHKYHAAPGDLDNDLFFVLGRVKRAEVDDAHRRAVEDELRAHLARRPLDLPIARADLAIVGYSDPRLPRASSRVFSLDEAASDPELI